MDKIYTKRVAFVARAMHLIVAGGVGSFLKSFSEMSEKMGWAVDCILDQPLTRNSKNLIPHLSNVNFILADEILSYKDHSAIFSFTDSINFESSINFRNALVKAYSKYNYDLIIANAPEAAMAAYTLDLQKFVPVVFYTHSENIVYPEFPKSTVQTESYREFSQLMYTLPGMYVGTQSEWNKEHLGDNWDGKGANINFLPMPISELNLLEPGPAWKDKHGVLFIGKWEPRKRPEIFIAAVVAAGLPAKILTSQTGAKKFQEAFDALGFSDYEIKFNIVGKEKTDFIQSARIGFHPSKLESYGFSAFETLHTGITYTLEKYKWWQSFRDFGIRTTTKDNAADDLVKAYNEEFDVNLVKDKLRKYHQSIPGIWQTFIESVELNGYTSDAPKSNALELVKAEPEQTISVEEYYTKKTKGYAICMDDIKLVIRGYNARIFNIFHTKTTSYLTLKDKEAFISILDKQPASENKSTNGLFKLED